MVKVAVDEELNMGADRLWHLFIDISNYPKYVKYVRSVEISGALSAGKEWHDLTTILWIPMRIKHKTIRMIKNKSISFEAPLPFGGKMLQSFDVCETGIGSRVWGEIHFDLGNPIANLLVGPILKARLKDMLISTLEKVRKEKTNDG
ncbi:MAG: hypothetical protein A2172_05185 [Candidatus Woykebacteria bacterium RBG_13_40_15]|uniref:Coenzyme Q-binding protein COQ10 START domain-containing protein n=1 Tax=Candidatus Woykebacteria bacterium RBG_13_40_15 TaxID=1802593 RepID=A0A1G1W8A2_9BACT|nr:MAG: hypothetical protein A2172_05185 [Candidatus Woykebacteria bacterium RBG_13_40_15]